jgi:hypothetical protein
MKHPPVQYPDEIAREMVDRFILGEAGEPEGAPAARPQAITAK